MTATEPPLDLGTETRIGEWRSYLLRPGQADIQELESYLRNQMSELGAAAYAAWAAIVVFALPPLFAFD